MQIVIDIPENELTCMVCPCREPEDNLCMLGYAIYKDYKHIDCVYNGKPNNCPCVILPEGHGRIADMDEAIKCIKDIEGEDAIWAISLIEWACGKRTLIEAERSDKEWLK